MGLFISFKRTFSNTSKQIKRSGWLSWASILVMALAFFIATIFIILAFASNLFLLSIENKPHIYIFFQTEVNEDEIISLKEEWSKLPEIDYIEYTKEQDALTEFREVQERTNPQVAESIRDSVLPASLGIRLHSIQDADKIIELAQAEQADNPDIFAVRFSKDIIDTIKTLFYWLRLGGGVIMALLLLVIFLFTLLTVEFRTFIRSEEIGIMQLVGGSLWFIRAPLILEGAIYGLIGSFISTSVIFASYIWIFLANNDSRAVTFVLGLFGDIKIPQLEIYHYGIIFLGMIILGGFIGAFNSMVAIRRYIK